MFAEVLYGGLLSRVKGVAEEALKQAYLSGLRDGFVLGIAGTMAVFWLIARCHKAHDDARK